MMFTTSTGERTRASTWSPAGFPARRSPSPASNWEPATTGTSSRKRCGSWRRPDHAPCYWRTCVGSLLEGSTSTGPTCWRGSARWAIRHGGTSCPHPPPTVGEALHDLMSAGRWPGADGWRRRAQAIAPTIVGGSKKHGGPDLGPTRAREAWKRLGVDGLGIADDPPGRRSRSISCPSSLPGWSLVSRASPMTGPSPAVRPPPTARWATRSRRRPPGSWGRLSVPL